MKLSVVVNVLILGCTNAFAPALRRSSSISSSQLNLFGGGNKDGESKGPGGGMMNQLAMFKKAQEMAKKETNLRSRFGKGNIQGKCSQRKSNRRL
mmetsp:Transcript_10686/g.11446  ORF Transcript_10686/g.11446 Transcript_10686/m.11446 type:complete len:95 (+) Transcript_10686:130-414(+)